MTEALGGAILQSTATKFILELETVEKEQFIVPSNTDWALPHFLTIFLEIRNSWATTFETRQTQNDCESNNKPVFYTTYCIKIFYYVLYFLFLR